MLSAFRLFEKKQLFGNSYHEKNQGVKGGMVLVHKIVFFPGGPLGKTTCRCRGNLIAQRQVLRIIWTVQLQMGL